MRLFKRGKPNAPVPRDELKWYGVQVTPRQNAKIVFEWGGARFTGEYVDNSKPWGTAWYIHLRYFSLFGRTQLVSANQIKRWAYVSEN